LVPGVSLLLLAGAVGLWAGGVFRLRTPEGVLVIEVNKPNPDVYVDGAKVAVTWGRAAGPPSSASGPGPARWS
jgi:hypothetical protein